MNEVHLSFTFCVVFEKFQLGFWGHGRLISRLLMTSELRSPILDRIIQQD